MGCVWLIYRKWGYAIGGNIVTRKRSLIPWGIINRLKIPNGHRHTNFMINTKRARNNIIPLMWCISFFQAMLVRHCLVTKLNLSMSLKWSIMPKKEKARFVSLCFFVVVCLLLSFFMC